MMSQQPLRLWILILEQNGYVNDINKDRLHHEIYMSDAKKGCSGEMENCN